MNTASILLPLRNNRDTLHLNALSDQSLMELFIEGLDADTKARFQHRDGTYKDVCKWGGVTCDGRRCVRLIQWEQEFQGAQWCGKLDFAFLPRQLESFVFKRDINQALRNRRTALRGFLTGKPETSTLPSALRYFEMHYQLLGGTFDFRRLPFEMIGLTISKNMFHGSAQLTMLPRGLDHLYMAGNRFSGSLCLDFLPKSLVYLDASRNNFSGSVSLDNLPETIVGLSLCENRLTGSIHLLRPPPGLRDLNLMKNDFSGTAVVAREAHGKISIKGKSIVSLVDENGVVCPIPKPIQY